MVTRGFTGDPERRKHDKERLPPGQSVTDGFPVLTSGPTPEVDLSSWKFIVKNGVRPLQSWDWQAFNKLPKTAIQTDIHCVTTWSKFDTRWAGVLIDDLFTAVGLDLEDLPTKYILAHTIDGYSTNIPVSDLVNGQAMIATHFNDQPLEKKHGGPARLLVPHLYFWKSAKWVNGLQFTKEDVAGFWELRGYHMRGDPFKEQRYGG